LISGENTGERLPKISIALFGRNDNYGGDFIEKLSFSIKSIQRALKDIDYEIVLLDYNPPKDKPLLSECFPIKDFPRVKHVVFSHEDHLEFIDCHLRAGAKLLKNSIYNHKREMSVNKIKAINFLGAGAAAILSVKNCTGDYILSTGTDNIFPKQFGDFVDKLEPNILYRTIIWKMKEEFKEIRKILFSQFDNMSVDNKLLSKNYFKKYEINFKIKKTIWSSPGNFLLMDKNSWKEVGGYLPTINPRPPFGDCQVVFHALICGKKVKYVGFPIFNICYPLGKQYKGFNINSNYVVRKNKIEYNHRTEIMQKQWKEFTKWAKKSYLEPEKEYFIKIKYKKRLEEIKQLFKSFLPEKFLLK